MIKVILINSRKKMDGYRMFSELIILFFLSITFIGAASSIAFLAFHSHQAYKRNEKQSQLVMDGLMALIDKRAAQVAANMSNVRSQVDNAPSLTPDELEKAKARAEHDRMLNEIAHATVLNPEQEKFLQEHANGSI